MTIGDQAAELARSDIVASAAKSIPPVSVASATLLGYPMADWVMLLTIVYTILQIFALVRDKFWPHRRKQKKE
jgi:Phage holin T7 family, holin superfamily II